MRQKTARQLARLAEQDHSPLVKCSSLLFGGLLFLVGFPAVLLFIGNQLAAQTHLDIVTRYDYAVAAICIPLGLTFVFWAVAAQWTRGRGTPSPTAATRLLVTSGPYALCRNPIQFGAMCYYCGMGTLFGSLAAGAVCLLVAGLAGTLYHKDIEERELEIRFGADYLDYKKRVPFLVPRLWRVPARDNGHTRRAA